MTKSSSTDRIIVAVYGSLKRGFYNHYLLETSTFMATGQVDGFQMFNLGSYPMVVSGSGQIEVELFEVNRATFTDLDRLEGFPNYYGRQMVTVQTPHCPVEAWMYLGQRQQVKSYKQVRSGTWKHDVAARVLR